ncbi:MAG: S8 family serine peptidase [Candidatus Lokiarchaeota archaeon]
MGENPTRNNSLRLAGDTETLDYGIDAINADLVWGTVDGGHNVTTNIAGQGVKVCVIDSGIDSDHPDLNISGSFDSFPEDDELTVNDHNGHGTECAGIICAQDNSYGVIGVAPKAKLYAAKVVGFGDAISSWEDVFRALDYYSGNYNGNLGDDMGGTGSIKVDVMSLSFGGNVGDYYSDYNGHFESCFNKGITMVAATMNGGPDGKGDNQISFPASSPYTIAVGSVEKDGNGNWVWSDFSNYGDGLDLVAPGVNIYSTTISPDYYMGGLDGTSFAVPMVSGVCALLLSKAFNQNFDLTNKEIKWILCNTTDKVGGVTYTNGWNQYYGYGMVNAKRAVDNCRPPKITIKSPNEGGTITGSTNIKAKVTDDGEHTVQCRIDDGVWHDMSSIGNEEYQWTWDVTDS